MMRKNVKLLDLNDEPRSFEVPTGSTIIGRQFLKCANMKVPREQGTLTRGSEEAEEVGLTSVHSTKLFSYRRRGDTNLTILQKDETVQLQNGDVFFLMPSSPGYQVEILNVEQSPTVSSAQVPVPEKKTRILTPVKRQLPAWLDDSEDEEEIPVVKKKVPLKKDKKNGTVETPAEEKTIKKKKVVPKGGKLVAGTSNVAKLSDSEPEEAECKNTAATSTPNEVEKSNDTFLESDEEASSKATKVNEENLEDKSNDTFYEEEESGEASSAVAPPPDPSLVSAVAVPQSVTLHSLSDEEEDSVASAAAAVQRPVCPYGAACYRRNPQHKVDMSHPGDVDYPPPAPLLVCPFGTSCFRANPQHKKDYDHTQPPVPTSPPQSPPIQGARKPRKAKGKKTKRQDWDSDDSDDSYDGSFIDDSDVDESWTPDD